MRIQCPTCQATLASPAGLRRHVNSQHTRATLFWCHCGKKFRDPAGASRCRAGHRSIFCCPVPDCPYRATRHDTAKSHLKRMHKSSQGLKIKKILHNEGSSTPSSSASPATPSLELASGPPSIFQPNFNPVPRVPYQLDPYDRNQMPSAEVYTANDIGPGPSRPFYMTYEMPVLPTPSAYSYYPTGHHVHL